MKGHASFCVYVGSVHQVRYDRKIRFSARSGPKALLSHHGMEGSEKVIAAILFQASAYSMARQKKDAILNERILFFNIS